VKKIIVLTVLAMALVFGVFAMEANAEDDVCPECDLYTYNCLLPYVTPAKDGWWTGIVLTNPNGDPALCRIDYIGDNSLERFDLDSRSQKIFVAGVEEASYARVRSSVKLDVITIISNSVVAYGYDRTMLETNPEPLCVVCPEGEE